MRALCEQDTGEVAVVDFVCPRRELREVFNADVAIWMDTRKSSVYRDTNKFWREPTPDEYHLRITSHDDDMNFGRVVDLVANIAPNIESGLV